MRKRILFIIGVLDSGGVAKSIVNLLNVIDRQKHDVHLLVMSEGLGPFGRYIPDDVTIHRNPIIAALLCGPRGLGYLLGHGHWLLALGSLLRLALSRIDKPMAGWLLAHLFPKQEDDWDVIVDYNGQQQLYYMVDKLKGRRKVTFFHNDYRKWPFYERMDRRYFPHVDCICSISEQCVASLREVFPEVADRVMLFPNISLPLTIEQLADEPVQMPQLCGTVLLTVGHISHTKGIDLILESARIMRSKGLSFTWLLLGSTDMAGDYLKAITQFNEEGTLQKILTLGVSPNPYPYMKRADIIVHPSRFEGKSIALDEAKILCKPIVVTNFSTVHDQFEDGVNACICGMSGQEVAEAVERMMGDPVLCDRFRTQLRTEREHCTLDPNLCNRLVEN